MNHYINNILPRLKEFSESLDRKEVFIDHPWVIVDDNLNQEKYIFKRNGDLIMSLNGQVTIGKWEYLSAARSLLIDRIQDKILLNQNFIDPAVMILKKDGFKDENLILINEILLPDLNAVGHLKKLFYRKSNIAVRQLKSGEFLELYNFDGVVTGHNVTIEGSPVSDGYFELASSKTKYLIEGSKIKKVMELEDYDTDKGQLVVEQQEYYSAAKGDSVFQNGSPAPDGKYRIGFMKHLIVENGIIIK